MRNISTNTKVRVSSDSACGFSWVVIILASNHSNSRLLEYFLLGFTSANTSIKHKYWHDLLLYQISISHVFRDLTHFLLESSVIAENVKIILIHIDSLMNHSEQFDWISSKEQFSHKVTQDQNLDKLHFVDQNKNTIITTEISMENYINR